MSINNPENGVDQIIDTGIVCLFCGRRNIAGKNTNNSAPKSNRFVSGISCVDCLSRITIDQMYQQLIQINRPQDSMTNLQINTAVQLKTAILQIANELSYMSQNIFEIQQNLVDQKLMKFFHVSEKYGEICQNILVNNMNESQKLNYLKLSGTQSTNCEEISVLQFSCISSKMMPSASKPHTQEIGNQNSEFKGLDNIFQKVTQFSEINELDKLDFQQDLQFDENHAKIPQLNQQFVNKIQKQINNYSSSQDFEKDLNQVEKHCITKNTQQVPFNQGINPFLQFREITQKTDPETQDSQNFQVSSQVGSELNNLNSHRSMGNLLSDRQSLYSSKCTENTQQKEDFNELKFQEDNKERQEQKLFLGQEFQKQKSLESLQSEISVQNEASNTNIQQISSQLFFTESSPQKQLLQVQQRNQEPLMHQRTVSEHYKSVFQDSVSQSKQSSILSMINPKESMQLTQRQEILIKGQKITQYPTLFETGDLINSKNKTQIQDPKEHLKKDYSLIKSLKGDLNNLIKKQIQQDTGTSNLNREKFISQQQSSTEVLKEKAENSLREQHASSSERALNNSGIHQNDNMKEFLEGEAINKREISPQCFLRKIKKPSVQSSLDCQIQILNESSQCIVEKENTRFNNLIRPSTETHKMWACRKNRVQLSPQQGQYQNTEMGQSSFNDSGNMNAQGTTSFDFIRKSNSTTPNAGKEKSHTIKLIQVFNKDLDLDDSICKTQGAEVGLGNKLEKYRKQAIKLNDLNNHQKNHQQQLLKKKISLDSQQKEPKKFPFDNFSSSNMKHLQINEISEEKLQVIPPIQEQTIIQSLMLQHFGRDGEQGICKSTVGNYEDCQHIVSAKWWRSWLEYVCYLGISSNSYSQMNSQQRPAKIKNSPLLQNEFMYKSQNARTCQLKENLLEHHDFEAVPVEIFQYLQTWYGVDYEIIRLLRFDASQSYQKMLYVDLYPGNIKKAIQFIPTKQRAINNRLPVVVRKRKNNFVDLKSDSQNFCDISNNKLNQSVQLGIENNQEQQLNQSGQPRMKSQEPDTFNSDQTSNPTNQQSQMCNIF